jgi:hypothetical protein
MKRNPSNNNAVLNRKSKSMHQSTHKSADKSMHHNVKHWVGGIEINTGSAPTMDVRFLCAAIHYPYMFGNPLGDLCIDRHWATAFTLTCMEIDTFLGQNKRGFHWRQLDIEEGQPHWYWALGKEYDHQVLVTDLGAKTSVVIANSAADPRDALRQTIATFVDIGMRRAEFFGPNASNAGELQ